MHVRLHTSTGFLHACPSLCKPARDCAYVHKARASQHVALHACSRVCVHARGRCTHANTTASLHRPRARMHVTLHARTSPLQACTRYVQACRTACSLASHVCIDTRRTFSVKGTPTPPHSVVPLLFFFLIDKLFLLELFLDA